MIVMSLSSVYYSDSFVTGIRMLKIESEPNFTQPKYNNIRLRNDILMNKLVDLEMKWNEARDISVAAGDSITLHATESFQQRKHGIKNYKSSLVYKNSNECSANFRFYE